MGLVPRPRLSDIPPLFGSMQSKSNAFEHLRPSYRTRITGGNPLSPSFVFLKEVMPLALSGAAPSLRFSPFRCLFPFPLVTSVITDLSGSFPIPTRLFLRSFHPPQKYRFMFWGFPPPVFSFCLFLKVSYFSHLRYPLPDKSLDLLLH